MFLKQAYSSHDEAEQDRDTGVDGASARASLADPRVPLGLGHRTAWVRLGPGAPSTGAVSGIVQVERCSTPFDHPCRLEGVAARPPRRK